MEARSGQNHDNKTTLQVNFTPTAASIMDLLCIFVITKQYFFSMLVIIFSNMSYFCFYYTNTFFIHTTNYFLVVLQIIFLMCIKNYFFIRPKIIFRVIANLFFCLQCIADLAVEVEWFASFVQLPWATISKTLQVEECFQRECQGKTVIVRERNERGFRLSYKICQEPIVCVLVMRFSGPKI